MNKNKSDKVEKEEQIREYELLLEKERSEKTAVEVLDLKNVSEHLWKTAELSLMVPQDGGSSGVFPSQ